MKINFILLLFIGFVGFIDSLIYIFIYKRLSKKCNYRCRDCKVWNCPAHYCNRKRDELLEEMIFNEVENEKEEK